MYEINAILSAGFGRFPPCPCWAARGAVVAMASRPATAIIIVRRVPLIACSTSPSPVASTTIDSFLARDGARETPHLRPRAGPRGKPDFGRGSEGRDRHRDPDGKEGLAPHHPS